MSERLSIPGGSDSFGRRISPFPIRDEHTLYEWAMIWTDRHPQPRQTNGTDAASMKDREAFMGARGTSSGRRGDQRQHALRMKANSVYRQIAEAIERGTIMPVKLAYCSDDRSRPDPTRHIVAAGPILKLADQRKDGGGYIKLLQDRRLERHRSAKGKTPPSRNDANELLRKFAAQLKAQGVVASEKRLREMADGAEVYIPRAWIRDEIKNPRGRPKNRKSQQR